MTSSTTCEGLPLTPFWLLWLDLSPLVSVVGVQKHLVCGMPFVHVQLPVPHVLCFVFHSNPCVSFGRISVAVFEFCVAHATDNDAAATAVVTRSFICLCRTNLSIFSANQAFK
mmetsp:Transcript_31010/g.41384  ORF Transcript_31010/g.41384 Transcript_31010/m.41384 type:complete len:113 (-) Transcript_31010:88-426(-)